MKTIKTLLFLSLSILLLSCGDDGNDDLNLDVESLKQTSWGGSMVQSYIGGESIRKSEVGIIFYTTENGQYDIKGEGNIDPEITRFEYSVDDKMLFIKGNGSLKGYWLLIEKSKNRIVLEQSSGGDYSYKATLTLARAH